MHTFIHVMIKILKRADRKYPVVFDLNIHARECIFIHLRMHTYVYVLIHTRTSDCDSNTGAKSSCRSNCLKVGCRPEYELFAPMRGCVCACVKAHACAQAHFAKVFVSSERPLSSKQFLLQPSLCSSYSHM